MNKNIVSLFFLFITFAVFNVGCSTTETKAIPPIQIAGTTKTTLPQNTSKQPLQYRAEIYVPDLSSFPDLASYAIGLPPYQYVIHGVTDFYFVTKNVSFKETMKQIDIVLKKDGFKNVTPESFKELTNGLRSFKDGNIKNTYQKNNSQKSTIQIINGGFDENKEPIVIVRMN